MELRPNKVCPVVLRRTGRSLDVLAFVHPLAGCQLVKGTIEAGEDVRAAALPELAEESGIDDAVVSRCLGLWSSGFEGQVWAFVECVPERPLPAYWAHHAPDDGGHTFRFFWQPLFHAVDEDAWHALFRGALRFLQQAADRPEARG